LALGGERDELMQKAADYVPRRSRFAETVRTCIEIVERSSDWLSAYEEIHTRYARFEHCEIHQEIGTLINTIHFAENTADGIGQQVMQGNDTDSFCVTAGS